MLEPFEDGQIMDKNLQKKNKNLSLSKKFITLAITLVSLSLLILIVGVVILINKNFHYKKELEKSNLQLQNFQENLDKITQENALIIKELTQTKLKLSESKGKDNCANMYRQCKKKLNMYLGIFNEYEFPC